MCASVQAVPQEHCTDGTDRPTDSVGLPEALWKNWPCRKDSEDASVVAFALQRTQSVVQAPDSRAHLALQCAIHSHWACRRESAYCLQSGSCRFDPFVPVLHCRRLPKPAPLPGSSGFSTLAIRCRRWLVWPDYTVYGLPRSAIVHVTDPPPDRGGVAVSASWHGNWP